MDERVARERDVVAVPAAPADRRRRAASRRVMRKAADDAPVVGLGGGALDHEVSTRIRATTGRGEPLDPATRSRLEPAFGTDLSAVRVHRDDAEAPRLMAQAYTIGRDIHFAPGRYEPGTAAGQHLLVHELAHVVQQGSGGAVHRYVDIELFLAALRAAQDKQARTKALNDQLLAAKNAISNRLANNQQKKEEVNERLKEPYRRAKTAVEADNYQPSEAADATRALFELLNTVEREVLDTATGVAPNALLQNNQARHDRTIEALNTFGFGGRATALTQARTTAVNSANAPAYVQGTAEQHLDTYLDLLQTEEMAMAPQRMSKVGTEFTFTSQALQPLDIVAGGDPITAASNLIRRWATALKGVKIFAGSLLASPTEVDEPFTFAKERKKEGHEDKSGETAVKFVYRLPSGAAWWWRANIDYACIECQADPVTTAKMVTEADDDANAVRQIIDSHIFGIATTTLELATHAEIGGGHLTLDRMTTFADNVRWFRNFLVLYAMDPSAARRDADTFNAVLLTELKPAGKAAFKKVISDHDDAWNAVHNPSPLQLQQQQGKHAKQPKTWDMKTFVDALTSTVFTKKNLPDPGQGISEESTKKREDQPAHYQSTNVEHMLVNKAKEGEIDSRRLEMRRVDAQQGIEDLANDLDHIVGLVQQCRAPGLITLRM